MCSVEEFHLPPKFPKKDFILLGAVNKIRNHYFWTNLKTICTLILCHFFDT
jgi:hypothetical protein